MTVTKTTKTPAAVAIEQKKQQSRGKKRRRESPFKRAPSAFILFARDERPRIRDKESTLGFGEISKRVGLHWKELSEEEKAVYEDKANAQKIEAEEHNRTVRETQPDKVEEYMASKRRKANSGGDTKKVRNRGANNFLLYSKSVHADVKAKFPTKSPSEIQKEIGVMWNALSEEEKLPWTKQWMLNKQVREAAASAQSEVQE